MKIITCRLPPLPRKNGDQKSPLFLCQSIALQQKCLTIEADRYPNEEDNQFLQVKPCQKAQEGSRPHSNKSQNSLKIRGKSTESHDGQRNYSYEMKKSITVSEIPPKVSAKSWIVYDMQQNKSLWKHRSHKQREMASLTKMMNLITILELMNSLGVDAREVRVRASKSACEITGTTAQLRPEVQYTLYDLYFGMMLPSGNDAAHLIAEVGGFLLKIHKDYVNPTLREINNKVSSEVQAFSQQFVSLYLREMNRVARKLEMISSNFANPHGLSNTNNYSTAQDLAKLCTYSMRNSIFRKIVQTKKHSYTLQVNFDKLDAQTTASNQSIEDDKQNLVFDSNIEHSSKSLLLQWENTNKMLGEGWSGIKTGITPNAGPCLAASLARTLQGKRYEFLVILLSSQSMEARWREVRDLVDWAIQNRRYI